jgi:hypothetical protein
MVVHWDVFLIISTINDEPLNIFSGNSSMQFFRQNLMPALILVIFLVALAATSVRIFLPADLAGPAPM